VVVARETSLERIGREQKVPFNNDTITSGESYDLEDGGIRVHLETVSSSISTFQTHHPPISSRPRLGL
jgi:hypothetical protein